MWKYVNEYLNCFMYVRFIQLNCIIFFDYIIDMFPKVKFTKLLKFHNHHWMTTTKITEECDTCFGYDV